MQKKVQSLPFQFVVQRLSRPNLYLFDFSLGPDEVISALKYYVDTFVPRCVKKIQIFADNAAAHNKNGALFCAYQHLESSRFESIEVRYAEVGHSRMAADSDFGKIVLRKKKYETIYGPSQYVKIIEESNLRPTI